MIGNFRDKHIQLLLFGALGLALLFYGIALTVTQDEQQDTAQLLPPGWHLLLNGDDFAVEEGMLYPPLVYRESAYIPLTHWVCEYLGLKPVTVTKDTIEIERNEDAIDYPFYSFYQIYHPSGSAIWKLNDLVVVTPVRMAVILDGKQIHAGQLSDAPFLHYGDIVYMPLNPALLEDYLGIACENVLVDGGIQRDEDAVRAYSLWRSSATMRALSGELLQEAGPRMQREEFFSVAMTHQALDGDSHNMFYREHHPTGLQWWTYQYDDYCDHYLLSKEKGYSYHENIAASERNSEKIELSSEIHIVNNIPPSNNLWEEMVVPITSPQVIPTFDLPKDQEMIPSVVYNNEAWELRVVCPAEPTYGVVNYEVRFDLATGKCISFSKEGLEFTDIYRYYYDREVIMPLFSRSEWLLQLLDRAEEKLNATEWLVVRRIYEAPVWSTATGFVQYERNMFYREYRPTGTVWYTKTNGDHYLITPEGSYFFHEEGEKREDFLGNIKNYVEFDNQAQPPGDELWQWLDQRLEAPQVVFSFDTLRQHVAELELGTSNEPGVINILCRNSKTSFPYYFIYLRIAVDSGECRSFFVNRGNGAGDYYNYFYDVEFALPSP